ncbi:MAG: hypothetical protein NTU97_01000 [Candidatus Magasanikbacteria bacterium]|nr:hypothetical protein [Candidatus Magasanikbacteria bacterium]
MNNFTKEKSLRKKIVIGFLLFFLVCGFVLAKPAKAEGLPVGDSSLDAKSMKDTVMGILDSVYQNLGSTAGKALFKTVKNFLNKFAQDSATWLASGKYNKGPMFVTDAKKYWQEAGESAAGDFIGNFGDEWALTKKYGINLCSPQQPDLQLKLKLQSVNVESPQPRCNFKAVIEAYKNIGKPEYWSKVGAGFESGQNGLSLSRKMAEGIEAAKNKEKVSAVNDLTLNGKTIPLKSPVDKKATAPEEMTKEQVKAADAQRAKEAKEKEAAEIKTQLGDPKKYLAALKDVGMVFLDTLSNKLQEKLLSTGLTSVSSIWGWIKDATKDGAGPLAYEAQLVGSREAAEAYFADFTKPTFTEIEDYQYLPELSTDCSTNPGPYCGALDESFKDIFSKAQNGEALTVGEAIKQKMLNGNWPILGPGVPCKAQAYCYDNLVKLRILRILPVGWEMAAKESKKLGQPFSLDQIVARFYSPVGNAFYHLIDPNWLIVAPKARCAAQSYGSVLYSEPQSSTPGQRVQSCADIQNCVGEDPATKTCNSWGYCLRERNYWRLGGNSCDEQFNTCTNYTSSKGQTSSYLANTLNKGICTSDNVGCRGYATNATSTSASLQWDANGFKIYFDQDAQSCDVANEGCTRFLRTAPEVFNQPLNLKKAPSYYNCYGENLVATTPSASSLSSSTLAWAVNKSDLYKIFAAETPEKKQACANFAQVCSAAEKGCELYTPSNGNPAVPGVLTPANQCPNDCVGYETYIEQPISQFSTSTTNYFIPATAKSCTAQNVGCEEFVNLEAQSAGGEQKEFYSELRTCSKHEDEGATFYTWEGSNTTGYQLKTYNLKTGYTGLEPAYNTNDAATIGRYNSQCDEASYANRISLGRAFNPDCREFYSRSGTKSYRLYSKTITVSATECKTLRKTVSDETSCLATGGTWNDQKFCTYLAITKEAKTCPVEAVGCRAYKGNAGNNFITIASQDFESGAVGADALSAINWVGKFSAESTVVGGKSLAVSAGTSGVTQTFGGEKNKTYLVYFWAKGNLVDLGVSFFPSNPSNPTAVISGYSKDTKVVKLSNNWELYTVGPFTSTWDASQSSSTIQFISSSATFYLDNYNLKVMTANVNVIKDSWVTPVSCDNVNNDPNGESSGGSFYNPLRLVPQAQLGCTSYKTRQKQSVAAKSFNNICREEAVGCEELVDTFNTFTAASTIVNAVCELNVNSTSNQAVGCKDSHGKVYCDVAPNQKSCRFNFVGTESELTALTTGATTIDAEGKTYSISFSFDAAQSMKIPQTLGLAPAGDRKVYLVNDPAFQCADDNLGCRALGNITYDALGHATSTATSYIKDQPDNYARILCEKDAEGCDKYTTGGGGTDYFRDPVVFGNDLCEWKASIDDAHPYGGWVIKGTTSTCYSGLNYKTKKNGDAGYRGAVGICPVEQNGCTEFVDPSGADNNSINPLGQPYYLIKDADLDRSSCQGQVSLQKGCVLFNETSKGDLLWNTADSYKSSELKNYELVNPIVSSTANNANVVLKVKRDRVCGEWLACASTMKVIKDGKPTEICTQFRNCDQAAVSNAGSDELLGKCAHWVDNSEIWPTKTNRLDNLAYQTATGVATFSAKDFSGYSIPNGYQISDLIVGEKDSNFGLKGSNPGSVSVFSDKPPTEVIPETCRGFASGEATAESKDLCSFTKVTYSGGDKSPIDKYYPVNQLLDAAGICDGGAFDNGQSKLGIPCNTDSECADEKAGALSIGGLSFTNKCLINKTVTRQFGWQGFCLFKDPNSKACMQWFPLTAPSNANNLYELNQTAGYYPPEGSGKFWCMEAKGNANRKSALSDGSVGIGGYAFVGRHEMEGYRWVPVWTPLGFFLKKRFYNTWEMFPETDFWRENNLALKEGEVGLHISELAAIGIKITNAEATDWPSKGSELMIYPNQILTGINSGGATTDGASTGNGFYWSGPVKFTPNNGPYLDVVWAQINKQSKSYFNSSDFGFLSDEVCQRLDSGGEDPNFLGVRFQFNAKTGVLENISTKFCDASDGAGWLQVDVVYYLKEVCNDVRQTVDTESIEANRSPFGLISKARTDRIWQGSKYKLGKDLIETTSTPLLDLTYDQAASPFGSFSRNNLPVTTTLESVMGPTKFSLEKSATFKSFGYWPITFAPGGGSALNCAEENQGDCGKIGLCQGGSKKGMSCNPTASLELNGCRTEVANGTCSDQYFCSSMLASGVLANSLALPCADVNDFGTCRNQNLGPCVARGYCNETDASKDKVLCLSNNDCDPGISCKKDYTESIFICEKNNSLICGVKSGSVYVANDQNCILTDSSYNVCEWGAESTCKGGEEDGKVCSKDTDCKGGTQDSFCDSISNTRGTCVGGQNHGLACAGNSDCPSKTYTATENNKEVEEKGYCSGISLDNGKIIPNTMIGRVYERIKELFVNSYGTWVWNGQKLQKEYNVTPPPSNRAGYVSAGGADKLFTYISADRWYTSYSKYDDSNSVRLATDGCGECSGHRSIKCQGNPDCPVGDTCTPLVSNEPVSGPYPAHACNPAASITPNPPKIYSLKPNTLNSTGFTWGTANNFSINLNPTPNGTVSLTGSNSVVTANFFAYADNDQMPIQRVAIDWGDGTPAYVTKGWFKNQKPWCANTENKVCGRGTNYNMPCNGIEDCDSTAGSCVLATDNPLTLMLKEEARLYFGNSAEACDTNYFSFKHVYECPDQATIGVPACTGSVTFNCKNIATGVCKFKPKVQILDNWGWCNGVDGSGNYRGYWNDSDPNRDYNTIDTNPLTPISELQRECSIDKTAPWTPFGGIIEVSP